MNLKFYYVVGSDEDRELALVLEEDKLVYFNRKGRKVIDLAYSEILEIELDTRRAEIVVQYENLTISIDLLFDYEDSDDLDAIEEFLKTHAGSVTRVITHY